MKKHPALPYVLLTFCAFFWAGSSVVGRHVAGEVPPLGLNFWRWLFAFLIVLTWTWRELYDHRALVQRKWKYISFLALSSAIGFGALHYVALQYTTAINGALLIAYWQIARTNVTSGAIMVLDQDDAIACGHVIR